MPEGDTVWRTAHRLDQALAGRVITGSDLRWPSLATVDLTGATTREVVARGKHVLHRLDSGLTLHSHLRMEGSWWLERTERLTGRRARGHTVRALLSTTEWTALGIRLGMLDLVPTPQEDRLVGHLGPDVLGTDWDPPRAAAALRAAPTTAAAALLDQRNLAGVGTFWASEALFVHRLGPWTAAGDVPADVLDTVLTWLHAAMRRAAEHAVQSSTGVHRAGETGYVHARSGRACRRCGGVVRVAMAGTPPQERTVFYCPTCQGGLAPTDDGRPQRPLSSGERSSPRRGPDRGAGRRARG